MDMRCVAFGGIFIVAMGDVIARVDACDVWAEVSVEEMRRTTSVVTFEEHL